MRGMRIGLTGGIGSGKSAVAQMLAECGAFVIDTDELAREVVTPGSAALAAIAHRWPQVVVAGALDRAALAQVVFADAAAREHLNAIVHPPVRELAHEREQKATPGQLIVHVVPLLFETGYAELVDRSLLVLASPTLRLARVLARDGVNEVQIRARMQAQIDPNIARLRADDVIENDADLETLRAKVQVYYAGVTAQRSRPKS